MIEYSRGNKLCQEQHEREEKADITRGIGKQNNFEDDEDRQKFIDTLLRYKEELKFEIHAYCLLDNHVHLLIGVKRTVPLTHYRGGQGPRQEIGEHRPGARHRQAHRRPVRRNRPPAE